MLENNFIGKRIKQLRKELKMSMADLAKYIDSSPGYISDVEKGKVLPGIEKMIKICKTFNLSLSSFFNDNIASQPLTPEMQSLLDSTKDFSPEQLQKLTDFIRTMK